MKDLGLNSNITCRKDKKEDLGCVTKTFSYEVVAQTIGSTLKKWGWFFLVGCLFLQGGCGLASAQGSTVVLANRPDKEPAYLSMPGRIIKEASLSEEIEVLAQENQELLYREYNLNEIPVLEVTPIACTPSTPIVVFLHGITSGKERVSYVLTALAKEGYRAVSFDLPGHGQRSDGAYAFMDIVLTGEKELSTLLDYYEHLNYNLDEYALGGFSTGAVLSVNYAFKGIYTPSILFSISGIADWSWMAQSSLLTGVYEYGERVRNDGDLKRAQKLIEENNTYGDFEKLSNTNILLFHGQQDSTFPWEATFRFYEDLKEGGHNEVYLDLEENTGHEFSGNELILLCQELQRTLPVSEEE